MSLFTETEESGQFIKLNSLEHKVLTHIIQSSTENDCSFTAKKAGTLVIGTITARKINALMFYNKSTNRGFEVYKFELQPQSASIIEAKFVMHYQDL